MPRAVRRASKTTPRVKDCRVQRKNHRDVSWSRPGPVEIRIDVPGAGYRHVLNRELVERFVAIIPDWREVSRGLEAIVLAPESRRADGWYRDGVISFAAWYDPIPFTTRCSTAAPSRVRSRAAPTGTLLDRACVHGTSDVSGGWDHAMSDYPLLVAGRAGGALTSPGVHVTLGADNAARVPLTCLNAVVVPIDAWGSDQFLTAQPVAEILQPA